MFSKSSFLRKYWVYIIILLYNLYMSRCARFDAMAWIFFSMPEKLDFVKITETEWIKLLLFFFYETNKDNLLKSTPAICPDISLQPTRHLFSFPIFPNRVTVWCRLFHNTFCLFEIYSAFEFTIIFFFFLVYKHKYLDIKMYVYFCTNIDENWNLILFWRIYPEIFGTKLK